MAFDAEPLPIDGVQLLRSHRFGDDRGWFLDTYHRQEFERLGLQTDWDQHSLSFSRSKHTVRGFHFQALPNPQAKLVRVINGRVFDVVVDLRTPSATFGQHVSIELDADRPAAVLIPSGVGHAFCSLEPDTVISYLMSSVFAAASYSGVNAFSTALGILWPVDPDAAVMSERDRLLPAFDPELVYFPEAAR